MVWLRTPHALYVDDPAINTPVRLTGLWWLGLRLHPACLMANPENRPMFVAVVQSMHGEVLRVLGRGDGRLEAEAIRDTTRCENGEVISVHEVREPNVFDVHGTTGFSDWVGQQICSWNDVAR